MVKQYFYWLIIIFLSNIELPFLRISAFLCTRKNAFCVQYSHNFLEHNSPQYLDLETFIRKLFFGSYYLI